MARKQKSTMPLRKGVPHWLGIVVMFVLLIPNMMLNGAYTGSAIDISGSLGVLSEDISMTYYAASAGMAVTYPLIPFFRSLVTTKSIILIDLLLQIVLAIVCAQSVHIEINMVCGFLIGILKAFLMLEIISVLMPFFSPNRDRAQFYAYFYPMVFGLGLLSTVITAWLAYSYQWQYMYYLIIAFDLLAMVLVMLLFGYGRRPARIPWRQIDFVSITFISIFFLLVIYGATYGKVLDWFSSTSITASIVLAPMFLLLFLWKQSDKRYIDLSVLKSGKAIIGYLFMGLGMVFNLSSLLVSNYTTSVLRIDSVHSNLLSLWAFPGYIIAAIICFYWFRIQKFRFRVLIFLAMSTIVVYFGMLYFGLMPNGTYEFLIIPTIFKGVGIMILFIAFGVYMVEDLKPQLMLHNAFFMIAVRSVVVPVVGGAMFSNVLYRLVQSKSALLGSGLDMQNTIAMARYNSSYSSALAQGNSVEQATSVATNNLYNLVQTQAMMVSLKEILGWMFIVSFVVMVVVCFIPFHRTVKVKVPQTGIDMA